MCTHTDTNHVLSGGAWILNGQTDLTLAASIAEGLASRRLKEPDGARRLMVMSTVLGSDKLTLAPFTHRLPGGHGDWLERVDTGPFSGVE